MNTKVFCGTEINSIASQIREGVGMANETGIVCETPQSFTIEKIVEGTTYIATFQLRAKETNRR